MGDGGAAPLGDVREEMTVNILLTVGGKRFGGMMTEMTCAYCERRYPWERGPRWPFYPLYAQCSDCVPVKWKRPWWKRGG